MIALIVAHGKNGEIGHKGRLPSWKLSADFRHFKEKTIGHPIVMGRETYRSIDRLLPGRSNIVLTRTPPPPPSKGVLYSPNFYHGLRTARKQVGSEEIFIIGGVTLFEEALPLVDRMYITKVEGIFRADTFFPKTDHRDWVSTMIGEQKADAKNSHDLRIFQYDRI